MYFRAYAICESKMHYSARKKNDKDYKDFPVYMK